MKMEIEMTGMIMIIIMIILIIVRIATMTIMKTIKLKKLIIDSNDNANDDCNNNGNKTSNDTYTLPTYLNDDMFHEHTWFEERRDWKKGFTELFANFVYEHNCEQPIFVN